MTNAYLAFFFRIALCYIIKLVICASFVFLAHVFMGAILPNKVSIALSNCFYLDTIGSIPTAIHGQNCA